MSTNLFTTTKIRINVQTLLASRLKRWLGIRPTERILCAAIWINDGKKYVHQPKNIESGLVIAGRRHHNCFYTLFQLKGDQLFDKSAIEQGFITDTDRYVDRHNGYLIAKKAKQLFAGIIHDDNPTLISEELY